MRLWLSLKATSGTSIQKIVPSAKNKDKMISYEEIAKSEKLRKELQEEKEQRQDNSGISDTEFAEYTKRREEQEEEERKKREEQERLRKEEEAQKLTLLPKAQPDADKTKPVSTD
jgi:hypothetical protein